MSMNYAPIRTTVVNVFPPVQHPMAMLLEVVEPMSDEIAAVLNAAHEAPGTASNAKMNSAIKELKSLLGKLGTDLSVYQQLWTRLNDAVNAVERLYPGGAVP